MSALVMLDVAIGIIFIYLLLSLICSAFNEVIEGFLKKRAADLARGIRELLNDPQGNGLTQALYNHPIIFGLFKDGYNNAADYYKFRGKNLPSYIPARNFALALMDLVQQAKPDPTGNVPLSGAANATEPNLMPLAQAGIIPPPGPTTLTPLRNAIVANTNMNSHVKQVLTTFVDAAGTDVNKVRENIENWFNTSMDRVSGWYKRRVQIITFCLGLAIASAMNADTIAIFNSLANNGPLRDAIITSIEQNDGKVVMPDSKESEKVLDEYRKLGLPLGWEAGMPAGGEWVLKVIGLLITAFAVSLGAPFWFDLLNKVMVIRSTVKPHEKSPEESSEDRQR